MFVSFNFYFPFEMLFFSILFFSFFAVISFHPMQSIICLIFVFFQVSVIFVFFEAEFLAMLLLMVYVGAISTLFLFVVMLFNLINISIDHEFDVIGSFFYDSFFASLFYGFIFCFLFLSSFFVFFFSPFMDFYSFFYDYGFFMSNFCLYSNLFLIGYFLFNFCPFYLFFAAFVLFVAMVGVVVLLVDDSDMVFISYDKIFDIFFPDFVISSYSVSFWSFF